MEADLSTQSELCLTLPVATTDAKQTLAVLVAILDAVPLASVTLKSTSSGLDAQTAKILVDTIKKRGITALIADEPELVRTVKADGVHVSWNKDPASTFASARATLGERYVVGADAGRSRHDAMVLGEAGADYVAFGIPAHVEDRTTAEHRQCDLIAWWSEIFEVACVASDVERPDQANHLAQAGADFICVTVPTELTTSDAMRWALEMQAAITTTGVAA